jgi:hypothetical protein
MGIFLSDASLLIAWTGYMASSDVDYLLSN